LETSGLAVGDVFCRTALRTTLSEDKDLLPDTDHDGRRRSLIERLWEFGDCSAVGRDKHGVGAEIALPERSSRYQFNVVQKQSAGR